MKNEIEYAKKINEEYAEKSPSKADELKALDAKVRRPAEIIAYILGIVGALVLGVGMCLAMKVIGDLMILGVVVGVVGIAIVSLNYPVYKAVLKSRKAKYASSVLALCEEIEGKQD